MADGLSISGGAGSVAAALDDLVAAAALLDRVGDDLRAVAGRTAGLAVRPEVAQAALLCPVEAFRAETAVGASALGPSGAGVVALGTEAIGLAVRESVVTYREADRCAGQALESIRWTAGRAVGVWVTTEGLPVVVGVGLGLGATDLLTDGAVHEGVLTQLYDHPWVTEQLVGATPAALDGMLARVLGPHGSDLLGAAGWPSDGFDDFLDALLGLASVGGLLVDSGRFVVRPVREGRARSEPRGGPVDTLAELLGEQVYLGSQGHESLLTVREVRHPTHGARPLPAARLRRCGPGGRRCRTDRGRHARRAQPRRHRRGQLGRRHRVHLEVPRDERGDGRLPHRADRGPCVGHGALAGARTRCRADA